MTYTEVNMTHCARAEHTSVTNTQVVHGVRPTSSWLWRSSGVLQSRRTDAQLLCTASWHRYPHRRSAAQLRFFHHASSALHSFRLRWRRPSWRRRMLSADDRDDVIRDGVVGRFTALVLETVASVEDVAEPGGGDTGRFHWQILTSRLSVRVRRAERRLLGHLPADQTSWIQRRLCHYRLTDAELAVSTPTSMTILLLLFTRT